MRNRRDKLRVKPDLNAVSFVTEAQMKAPRFDSASILIVGDAMLDRYWHGDTARVSAEAPIPVVDVSEIEDRPGGAANVALNLSTLGASAVLTATVGRDEAGSALQARLEGAGIRCHLVTSDTLCTSVKLRIVSRNQQLIRADFEDITPTPLNDLLGQIDLALGDIDSVILSDYDKGVLEEAGAIISHVAAAGKPVLVDPKFKPFEAYRGATLIKPNRTELEHAVGTWSSEADMVKRCHQVMANIGVSAMLVTRASEGMTLVRRDAEEVHFPARTREVFDVSGAGDTVIATLAAALASGETLVDATGIANVAAGIVVGHFGITGVSGPELRSEIARTQGYDRGIMSQEQLKIAADEARARGQKIVFTNGCFDILHAGHVDYLADAKREGDILVVAVNGDESVHRLKGEGRPVNPVERRMILLAGLEAVDWVVAFDDDTPEALLETLRPDVLVKGGDYAVGQVVGADIVRGHGGEVKVLSLVEDCSTSALVEKIRAL